MNNYLLKGTYRKVYAIGEMMEFVMEFDPISCKAESPIDAMNTIRAELYDAGFEHILFTHIFVEIPMMQALELE